MEVTFDGVSYAYRGRPVLSGLDWSLRPGVTGLLGPNAAGKSTVLTLLVGLRAARSGRITVGDADLGTRAGRAAARRSIGYLPQRFALVPGMRVGDTVEYAAWLNGLSGPAVRAATAKALAVVDLADRADEHVRTLSGGLRQRLGIAAAIAHEPEVVVLDEPTVGLDPGQRGRVRSAIARIGQERTVVLSTHLSEDVAALCETVSILSGGRLRYHGPLTELTGADPATAADLERAYDELLGASE